VTQLLVPLVQSPHPAASSDLRGSIRGETEGRPGLAPQAITLGRMVLGSINNLNFGDASWRGAMY